MSQKITVEDCRFVLNSISNWVTNESEVQSLDVIRKAIVDLSVAERFNFARHLLIELEEYVIWYNQKHATPVMGIIGHPLVPAEYQDSVDALIGSFELYSRIAHEEYTWILNRAGICIIDVLIQNKSFPIDLLIDDSLLQSHICKPEYSDAKATIDYFRSSRIPEIIDYFRGVVPNSEHMSDKMVLSVAGVSV